MVSKTSKGLLWQWLLTHYFVAAWQIGSSCKLWKPEVQVGPTNWPGAIGCLVGVGGGGGGAHLLQVFTRAIAGACPLASGRDTNLVILRSSLKLGRQTWAATHPIRYSAVNFLRTTLYSPPPCWPVPGKAWQVGVGGGGSRGLLWLGCTLLTSAAKPCPSHFQPPRTHCSKRVSICGLSCPSVLAEITHAPYPHGSTSSPGPQSTSWSLN